ncbi:MAG: Bax inhibitor-1/YccA family protein [Gammaproteobacteria bacterium]|nr:Bax inhibitor-1/YccA family protein [Gammaproteobacteria bacterium]MBP9729255.1 Bax inhibitor-1/YccA family protein [Gammaproteobacteria bacterium]
MRPTLNTVTRARSGTLIETNSVIRNTYMLLGLTLGFSAFTAWFAMLSNARPMGLLVLPIYMGLLFMTQALRNSAWGIASIFAFTGFMGYTLGPLLNMAIQGFSNGPQLIMTSLGLTAFIFFCLSAYALTTRKDFSYMGGFLFVASTVAFVACLALAFFPIPGLYLMVCAGFVLLASGMILFETSRIIHGGEQNYIMATISLYVSIYNLFISLLQLLMIFAGNRRN